MTRFSGFRRFCVAALLVLLLAPGGPAAAASDSPSPFSSIVASRAVFDRPRALIGGGAIRTGWFNDKGTWYHLSPTGAMTTGWLNTNGTWYHLSPTGAMTTGTAWIDGRRSLFGSDGAWRGYTDLEPIMRSPKKSRSASITAMVTAYSASGRSYPSTALARGGSPDIRAFASIVYDEAVLEGVSPELVFCQAMKETAWLGFGGDVSIAQFNFAGIGAVGGGSRGAAFPDVRTGLRAQVQHLRAYADADASPASLHRAVVDPRFSYVRKGSAVFVEHLGIQENPARVGWAASPRYGYDLVDMMNRYFE